MQYDFEKGEFEIKPIPQRFTTYPVSYILIFISINKSVRRYTDKHSITVYIWLYFLCGTPFFLSKCLYIRWDVYVSFSDILAIRAIPIENFTYSSLEILILAIRQVLLVQVQIDKRRWWSDMQLFKFYSDSKDQSQNWNWNFFGYLKRVYDDISERSLITLLTSIIILTPSF